MPNRTQLTPEGAAIAQAVARGVGLQANVLAPNLRLRESSKPAPTREIIELPDPSSPALELQHVAPDCHALVCNAPTGLRLGMSILHRDGVDVCWSIVARRNEARLWKLDYASEVQCEKELESIRLWLDELLTNPSNVVFTCSDAKKLTLFNPITGQELS